MSETPVSLLERLRLRPDGESWQRLVDLYTPLLNRWLGRHTMPHADAEDLVQEVLAVVVRELPNFYHNLRRGAFRRWLRTILANRLRAFWRDRKALPINRGDDPEQIWARLEDPCSDLSGVWDREHDRYVLGRLLELLPSEFEPATWKAFRLVAVEGRSPAEVAQELGLSTNAIRIAKSRVLKRMRQEAEGLID